jgi:hypothetical protein
MMSGRCAAVTTNGVSRANFQLLPIETALYVPPMTWLELDQFSDNSVCAVLASGPYDESDYIRSWSEFLGADSLAIPEGGPRDEKTTDR